MKKYTIGALFTPDFKRVLLIKKVKPAWQKDKLNFPGGSIEENESCFQCVAREFAEETGLDIPVPNWKHIGCIINADTEDGYEVDLLTSIYYPELNGHIKQLTQEKVQWVEVEHLPYNVISNLHWLIPFAVNYWQQGNHDQMTFGQFTYEYNNIEQS